MAQAGISQANQPVYFQKHQTVIVPNRWQGEINCVVGPFSSQEVADYFASRVVDFGHYEVFSQRVFPKRDAWYVEIQPSDQD